MSKKMLIDATHAEETRVVVVDGNKVEEFDFETLNKRQLAGNIYLAKVTRVEPSLQAAFVDYGGNRHGFLAFAEIHPDYYQIPVADRKALLEEERAYNRAQEDDDNRRSSRPTRPPRPQPAPEAVKSPDEVQTSQPTINGMDVVDLGEETGADALVQTSNTSTQPHHDDHPHDHNHAHDHDEPSDDADAPFRSIDHASDTDDEIESIAEEDVAEEISQARKPRARRYKIQEVVKVRQIMLVQVVKEERGNKGAALTTYLSLAGRYCVLMPNTARGGGISRKITVAADRKKLKEIAQEIEVPEGAGLIIRTAGAKRTKPEIKRDYEYLMRLWEQIRELTMKSIAPAAIYEEGDLIKRSIRDLYSREIDEILVEGDMGYRTAKDFMRMIMPSHARQVVRYADPQPLFAKFGVESYLASMFNPTVQLKSGGYIVIGVTEALVAVDVNSGRAT
ncbi:MAG: ribonuclease E/G, partial [bacterium]